MGARNVAACRRSGMLRDLGLQCNGRSHCITFYEAWICHVLWRYCFSHPARCADGTQDVLVFCARTTSGNVVRFPILKAILESPISCVYAAAHRKAMLLFCGRNVQLLCEPLKICITYMHAINVRTTHNTRRYHNRLLYTFKLIGPSVGPFHLYMFRACPQELPGG